MKAILLIDVPDNTEFDKDYRLTGLLLANEYAENVGIEFKDARLKPVPKERDIFEQGYDEEDTRDISQWNKGWNACIDKLLGEEE